MECVIQHEKYWEGNCKIDVVEIMLCDYLHSSDKMKFVLKLLLFLFDHKTQMHSNILPISSLSSSLRRLNEVNNE